MINFINLLLVESLQAFSARFIFCYSIFINIQIFRQSSIKIDLDCLAFFKSLSSQTIPLFKNLEKTEESLAREYKFLSLSPGGCKV